MRLYHLVSRVRSGGRNPVLGGIISGKQSFARKRRNLRVVGSIKRMLRPLGEEVGRNGRPFHGEWVVLSSEIGHSCSNQWAMQPCRSMVSTSVYSLQTRRKGVSAQCRVQVRIRARDNGIVCDVMFYPRGNPQGFLLARESERKRERRRVREKPRC